MLPAQRMAGAPRLGPGNPPALPGARGDPPVQRGRQLQRHQRPPLAHAHEEPGQRLGRLGGAQPRLHRHARRPQPRQPGAIHPRVGVARRHHHARHTGGHQRVRARRRRPMMAARLQRHVSGAAARRRAGHGQRLRLGMRPPAQPGPPAPHHTPVGGHHHAPHRGVRPRRPQPARPQRQRRPHMHQVAHPAAAGSSSDPRNDWKSRASRKSRYTLAKRT